MLYKTDNMEAAIRYMVQRNDRCVILRRYFIKRAIRLRPIDLKDLGSVLCKPNNILAEEQINRWRRERGLLYYDWSRKNETLPECDALFFVECPLQYFDYSHYIDRVQRDIVIYKPPVWDLHEEKIETLWPSSDFLETFVEVIHNFAGRRLLPILQAVQNISGLPFETTAVFVAEEMEAITGINTKRLNKLLMNVRFKGVCFKCKVVDPLVPPDEPKDRAVYDSIMAIPPNFDNYRILSYKGLDWVSIARMVKSGSVAVKPDIYVVGKLGKLRFPKYEAINASYRADWYKMRNTLDKAPKYPIPPAVLANLDRIRSERYERSLSLVRIFDKVRLAHLEQKPVES